MVALRLVLERVRWDMQHLQLFLSYLLGYATSDGLFAV